jgi:hypothetical protein
LRAAVSAAAAEDIGCKKMAAEGKVPKTEK